VSLTKYHNMIRLKTEKGVKNKNKTYCRSVLLTLDFVNYPPLPKVRPVNGFSRLRRENVSECHWNLSILFTRYSVNHWQQKRIIIWCLLTINKIWNLPGIWNQSNLHPSSPSTGCIYCWRHRKLGQAHCFSR
jgi:hypothetical protein